MFFLTVVSLLCAAGIIYPAMWFLVFPGLAVFFHILRDRIKSVLGAAAAGLVFGFITGGAGIIWFWDTLPLDFLGIASVTAQRAGVAMTWAYVAFGLALPVTVGAAAIWCFRRSVWFPLIAGVLWTAIEYGRMWAFALVTWSPKSLLGPHFSAAAIGHSLAEHPLLLQMARAYGLVTLNYFVAAVAGLLAGAMMIKTSRGRRMLAVQAMISLALCAGPARFFLDKGPDAEAREPLRVAILAEQVDDVMNYDAHQIATQLIAEAAAAVPPVDVALIPEEISLSTIFGARADAEAFIARTFGDRDVLLLHTRPDVYPDDDPEHLQFKQLAFESTRRGIIGRYSKQMLMPLGEYAPAFARIFYSIVDDPDINSHLEDVDMIPVQKKMPESVTFRGLRFGGLLCSDLLTPALYRHLVRSENADVLINLANQFWFHGSRTLHWKSLQMARVHAVYNQRPILVANNLSPSYALDRSGRMLAASRWGERTVLYVDVP